MPSGCWPFSRSHEIELTGNGISSGGAYNQTKDGTIRELTQENERLKKIVEQQRTDLTNIEAQKKEFEITLQNHDREIRRLKEILGSIADTAAGPSPRTEPSHPRGRKLVVVNPTVEDNVELKKFPKTLEQRKFLKEAIENNDFLKHINKDQVNEIIDCLQRSIHSNGVFIKEGTNGDRLYILESGELEVTQGSTVLTTIKPPTVFGELAIIYNCKRTATVTAKTPTKTWMLERKVFQTIMKTTTNKRQEELTKTLKQVSLMKDFESKTIQKLAEVLREEKFKKGDYIVRQGEYGDSFYIIIEGDVDVTERVGNNRDTFIRTIGKGTYFGEKALLEESGKRGANVIAKTNVVRCMTLDKESFLSLIGSVADKDWKKFDHRPKSIAEPVARKPNRSIAYKKPSVTSVAHRVSLIPPNAKETRKSVAVLDLPKRKMHPSLTALTLGDFEFIGVLGVGGFGRVELVKLKTNPERTFALKCMKKIHIVETKQEEHIYSEKRIMRDSDCRFIVQLYRTFKDDKYVYMLMEPCLGGELWAKLRDDGYFDEARSRFYTACVIEALEYLHYYGIVYRDLKPENLLLDKKGYVKIVDFGFAKKIKYGEKTWTFCGTPEYVAPEVILNKGHDVAVDYWALGILIFEMLTGNPPFNSSDAMRTYRMALKGIDSIDWPSKVKPNPKNLIRRLCRENPAERIGNLKEGVREIQRHSWFTNFDWESLKNGKYNVAFVPEIKSVTDLRNFDRFEKEDENVPKETSGWDADF